MKGSVVHKILKSKLLSGKLIPGEEITVRIDDAFTQDALGTMVWLEVEHINPEKVKPRTINFIDHNTVQMGFENSDDHDYLQTVSRKYGAILSKAGNGICHQLYLENFAKPGNMAIASDSHTAMSGGAGCLGIGVGGLDVARGISYGTFTFVFPKIIKINLDGKLNHWVTAKGIVLKLISIFGTGNKGFAFEFSGPGVKTLSVPERATICNMGAEMGLTFSIFPSDENTYAFLKQVKRASEYKPIQANVPENKIKDYYFDSVNLDLSSLEPLLVLPPPEGKRGLGEISPVSSAKKIKVNQVCIGSCTNSSYHDLKIASHCLENSKSKKVHSDLELLITPGTRSLKQIILNEGVYHTLTVAGARITEEVCGPCVGQGYSPRSGGVRVATFNRNFRGRSGTKDANVYLSSPETAIAAAISGEISDPRELFKDIKYKRFNEYKYTSSNNLYEFNEDSKNEEIVKKGPNIVSIPDLNPLDKKVNAIVAIALGDSITTDDICPAGEWLKYRSNVPKYSEAVFSKIDPEFYKRALKNKEDGLVNIVVAGNGYGEGSSREHAALCLAYLGTKIVIAKSFQRIMFNNLINFGIIPLQYSEDSFVLEVGDQTEVSNLLEKMENNEEIVLFNHSFYHECTKQQLEILKAGSALSYKTS